MSENIGIMSAFGFATPGKKRSEPPRDEPLISAISEYSESKGVKPLSQDVTNASLPSNSAAREMYEELKEVFSGENDAPSILSLPLATAMLTYSAYEGGSEFVMLAECAHPGRDVTHVFVSDDGVTREVHRKLQAIFGEDE